MSRRTTTAGAAPATFSEKPDLYGCQFSAAGAAQLFSHTRRPRFSCSSRSRPGAVECLTSAPRGNQ
jgi:hypothetical protein